MVHVLPILSTKGLVPLALLHLSICSVSDSQTWSPDNGATLEAHTTFLQLHAVSRNDSKFRLYH